MDEKQTENPISKDHLDNTNVPVITADLEMLTIDINPPPTETKRILRKRLSKPSSVENDSIEMVKRRCSLRPKKRRIYEVEETEEEIVKEYYLDKKINKKSNNLETIFEETQNSDDDTTIHMSAKRFKRMLMFAPTASKLKKRRAKIQRVFGSKVRYKRCGSMQALIDKLNTIRENSPMKIDSELK
ncbi:hypothetical protein ALC56_11274 [Trachymyrmex septentrionalis]|uniref:Tantalus-like domain-containing protein n=1 Tax=Trachymyrmex septentrionalis TaxID=34720 RepID=A0A195F125_9HYME|nr:PREDICTED: uncharacterized protein LOC108752805 [Trachymyrmex septentrionalis]KYN34168.1 hypothetical protein ALC56_11274 [Trachymyrmex septentrionalis]